MARVALCVVLTLLLGHPVWAGSPSDVRRLGEIARTPNLLQFLSALSTLDATELDREELRRALEQSGVSPYSPVGRVLRDARRLRVDGGRVRLERDSATDFQIQGGRVLVGRALQYERSGAVVLEDVQGLYVLASGRAYPVRRLATVLDQTRVTIGHPDTGRPLRELRVSRSAFDPSREPVPLDVPPRPGDEDPLDRQRLGISGRLEGGDPSSGTYRRATRGLQELLNTKRGLDERALLLTESRDAETQAAIARFQRRAGLPATGIMDDDTWDALFDPDPPEAWARRRARSPLLWTGDQGREARELQELMNWYRARHHQAPIPVTGRLDRATLQSMDSIQRALGLEPTRSANQPTWDALRDRSPWRDTTPVDASGSDLEVLARIVKGECPAHMPWEGKVAVAAVVLNRVRSPRFPGSIREVAHQRGRSNGRWVYQFSCYDPSYRHLYDGEIPDYAWAAAREALRGTDPVRGADHYFNPTIVWPPWANRLEFVRSIGDPRHPNTTTHSFFRSKA